MRLWLEGGSNAPALGLRVTGLFPTKMMMMI